MVRIPVNGGEMNQFIAKQVLDIGVYGIVFPHVTTVAHARNAVAASRYARPPPATHPSPPPAELAPAVDLAKRYCWATNTISRPPEVRYHLGEGLG